MSVALTLNFLNELNNSILCEPLASIILFYSTCSIKSVIDLHEFNILFITRHLKIHVALNCKNCKVVTEGIN